LTQQTLKQLARLTGCIDLLGQMQSGCASKVTRRLKFSVIHYMQAPTAKSRHAPRAIVAKGVLAEQHAALCRLRINLRLQQPAGVQCAAVYGEVPLQDVLQQLRSTSDPRLTSRS